MISLYYLSTLYSNIHRLCAAMTHEIFMHRRSQEATVYVNFSLAMEMKFIHSVHMLIHPISFPPALNTLQSYLTEC